MFGLLRNSRFYILVFTLGLSLAIWWWVSVVVPGQILQLIRLQQIDSFIALAYLYVAMMISPVYDTWPKLAYKSELIHARRAIGVGAFYFAAIHSWITFFDQLGGFAGLGYLGNNYLWALGLGAVGLGLMAIMAMTSLDWVIDRLSEKWWKRLHRLIYVGGLVILLHVLMLGTHLADLTGPAAQVLGVGIGLLLILEARRLDAWISKYYFKLNFGVGQVVAVSLVAVVMYSWWGPSGGVSSVGVHSYHIQLAKEAAANNQVDQSKLPLSLRGDRNLRYTVSMIKPDQIEANQPVTLKFPVFNAGNGDPVQLFSKPYEKPMHLIVVNNELNYFNHIHPDQVDGGFVITTQFPSDGVYRLYLDFQPLGAIEQQVAFSVTVGQGGSQFSTQSVDQNLTKIVDGYEVTLTKSQLSAALMSLGQQTLSFSFKDAATGQPVTNLKPYLAAFGHLVMIRQQDYSYLHVHPTNLTAPAPDASGGPKVDFLPIGIYGPFKPGTYRVFGQFNPNGKLIVVDFTVEVGK